MAFPEFKWIPDLGVSVSSKPLVSVVSFGDGYELRVAESLNRVKKSYDLTFTKPLSEAREIIAFLEEMGGLSAFRWTSPTDVTVMVVCREWNGPNQEVKGLYTVKATFEEVFES